MNMNMKACDITSLNPDWLYHVTSVDNLPSILENGLLPELSDFTVEAIFQKRTDEMSMDWDDPEGMCMDEDELEREKDALYDDIQENTPEMVFAAELEYLPTILNMMTKNQISNISPNKIAVLAIKGKCKALFKEKEVASPVDWISTRKVPAACLGLVPKELWAPLLEKRN